MRAAEKSAVGPCGQPGLKTGSVLERVWKRNLFLKPNFLRLFGVKRQMAVFGDFRAGLSGRAGRRPVGPVKIGGFPGPERFLISTSHGFQFGLLEALGVSVR